MGKSRKHVLSRQRLNEKKFKVLSLAITVIALEIIGYALIPGRAATVYDIPANIAHKATCDTTMPDVTQAIENWLNTIPDGSVARFGANTCYRTELRLTLNGFQNFTIDGNGSALKALTDGCDSQDPNPSSNNNPYDFCRFTQYPKNDYNWPRSRTRLSLINNKNLTIKNIKLDGGHTDPGENGTYIAALEAQHGFDLGPGNDGITIDNVSVNRVRGDYIYLHGSSNVTVQNSDFGKDDGQQSGNGRMGMGIVSLTNVTIKNNEFYHMRRSCFDFEPLKDSAQIVNFTFEDNKVGTCRFGFVSMNPYGNAYPIISGIYFLRNQLIGKGFQVGMNAARTSPNFPPSDPNKPATYRWKDFKFIGNTSSNQSGNPGGATAYFTGISDIELRDNSVVSQGKRTPSMVLVQFNWVLNAKVIGNKTLYASNTVRSTDGYNLNGTPRTLNNKGICQRDNYIGNPLTLEALTSGETACAPDVVEPPPDTEKPTAPSNVNASLAGDNKSITVTWGASTDNDAVALYVVYRKVDNGSFGAVTYGLGLSYKDNNISAGKTYTYKVVAFDKTGNASNDSNTDSVTTPVPVTYLDSDINQDGKVDLIDFALLKAKWGDTTGLGRADINQDGKVDLLDFGKLVTEYGS